MGLINTLLKVFILAYMDEGFVFVWQVIPLDITAELQKQIMSELEILYKV